MLERKMEFAAIFLSLIFLSLLFFLSCILCISWFLASAMVGAAPLIPYGHALGCAVAGRHHRYYSIYNHLIIKDLSKVP